MTIRLTLRDLRPDLRVLGLGPMDGIDLGTSDDERPMGASLRLLSDPAVAVTTDRSAGELAQWLESRWASEPEAGSQLRTVADLVITLNAFDEAFRDLGVFPGNVYLASEDAVASVLAVAGRPRPEQDLADVLTALQFAELMYRFPVAYKFRGTHSHERQCRLNGWGRLLARRLASTDWSAELSAGVRDAVRAHVEEHADQYEEHLRMCVGALDDGEEQEWASALRLPVPVLT